MAFKLKVGDRLDVPVKGEVADGAGKLPFRFTLQMRRLDVAQYRAAMAPEAGTLVRDFLLDNGCDWRDQPLVMDEEGRPAPYSREAFECLLGLVGMEQICFEAYTQQLAAASKAQGRTGN